MKTEQEFVRWLAARTVTTAIPGQTFRLASGRESTYYLNLKSVLMTEPFMRFVGRKMCNYVIFGGYSLVAGMETAAIPLVSMAFTLSQQDEDAPEVEGFYLRKETKTHGAKRQIEYDGALRLKRVLVLEDVVTSGGSSMQAVNVLRAAGAIVDEVICAVDRQEGGKELFAENGVTLRALYTGSELLDAI